MCTSLVQIVFIIVLVAGAGLTAVAAFTSAWRSYRTAHGGPEEYFKFFTSCIDRHLGSNVCNVSWQNAPDWQKGAMACMILSLVACVGAFVWSCVACFMCCCRSCLTPPLPILAGLACLLDVIGVAIYGANSPDTLGDVPQNWDTLQHKGTFGYSFWVGVGACIALFIDTILGVCLVTTSKVSPV